MPPLLQSLLQKRGLADPGSIEKFLNPDYALHLGDPFQMTDMERAVSRILKAAGKGEKVAVYGDYDIDGIASTALMLEVLEGLGLQPVSYIPDRYDEGYGLHLSALQELRAQGIELIVTVDCGITSIEEAKWARENGLDLIITDHHDVPDDLPLDAFAVINPKRPDDNYPYKDLAGVGVAFALARALQQRSGIPAAGREKWLLDLVALGTVCDVMSLTGENRVLVKFGLIVLRKTRRVGLVALAQSAGVELKDLKAYHLGFIFGPRLNAAGRLEHANFSLELVTTKDPLHAQAHAFQLEELNHQRRLEQQRIFEEADALARDYSNDPVLVLADADWQHGIVGIVASKLSEKWQKPTLVLQILGDHAKGSGRSANGYNLIEGLRGHAGLFSRLGGHHFAAGFTVPTENIEELRVRLISNYLANESSLPEKAAREADIMIENPEDICWDLYNALEVLEPFGTDNPEPCFGLNKMKIISVDSVGKNKQHIKLKLTSAEGQIFDAMGFGLYEKYPNLKVGQNVDLLCYLQKNEWNGRSSLQLMLISIQ